MTNEEAIDVLKRNYPSSCFEDLCEAVDVAIKALSAEPTIYTVGLPDAEEIKRLKEILPKQQTVTIFPEPQRKKGKWIPVTDGSGRHECSRCHLYAPLFKSGEENLSPYCPNCGAEMREKEKEYESE